MHGNKQGTQVYNIPSFLIKSSTCSNSFLRSTLADSLSTSSSVDAPPSLNSSVAFLKHSSSNLLVCFKRMGEGYLMKMGG